METKAFDAVVRDLRRVTNRRNSLVQVGAALVALGMSGNTLAKKHRHRRKRKRRHNGGLGGPGDFLEFIRFIIENNSAVDINLAGFSYPLQRSANGNYCQRLDLSTIGPTQAHTFDPASNSAVAILNERFRFYGHLEPDATAFPQISIAHGGYDVDTVDCPTSNNAESVFKNKNLGVGQTLDFTMEGHHFQVTREGDFVLPAPPPGATTANEIVFHIKILS